MYFGNRMYRIESEDLKVDYILFMNREMISCGMYRYTSFDISLVK